MKTTFRRFGMAALVAAAIIGTAHADEIKVGAELPLTGSLARVGAGMQEGIMVAQEVFNKTNGKHTIKVITIDDESAPAKAIAAVEKLASDGVVAITGGYGSNNISPGYEKALVGLLQDVNAKSVSIVYSTKDATSGLAKDVEKSLTAKGV